ncbi:putative guanine nucleotide exchange factor [Heterostelium album PN500]|uniref:Putative guanine nucleotide exchange factor n=1 Tax=Heterostelium pallidum (strain ATCC 26659 / Pp 5 / PN500) TaxID=670386 RepID=D3B9T5_HETP5|nr:putative guanine nucleotide exchange factor [Heterostelium album PN500]EFA81997.1 putative guanine nucleotide exchange factor [Heterostelium album PN500]|eukprot:XP_020434114.1 putative guanine nucleotide exchange factor [Heterostelium album PN500]
MIESVEDNKINGHSNNNIKIVVEQEQQQQEVPKLIVETPNHNNVKLHPNESLNIANLETQQEKLQNIENHKNDNAISEQSNNNEIIDSNNDDLNTSAKNIDTTKSFTLGGNSKAYRDGNLIEHFIVVGLSADSPIGPNDKVSHDAKILYSYPPERVCDEQVIGFCFPDGIKLLQVSRRSSLTEIHAVLFKSLSQLEGSDTSFMFLITGGEHLLYVACVLNTEPIDQLPCFFNHDGIPPVSSKSSSPPLDPRKQYAQSNNICIFAPRCYCVISRFPFFKAHFDFIYSILGKERLNRINSILEKPPVAINHNKSLTMSSANDLNRLAASHSNANGNGLAMNGGGGGGGGGPLTKSLMRKPLPPLPAHVSQTNTLNLSGNSPYMVSPSDSPLFGSETTSLISKHSSSNNLSASSSYNNNSNNLHINGDNSKLSKSVGHSRSHSTPISNLANIQKIRQQQLQQQHQHQLPTSANGFYQPSSSQSPGTITDEALSAIQESLSISNDDYDDLDQMTDFTSSSNSVDFSADSSPTTANLQFDDLTNSSSTPTATTLNVQKLANGELNSTNTPIITKVDAIKQKVNFIDSTLDGGNIQFGNRVRTTLNTATTDFTISADSPISVSPVPPTAISNHSPTDRQDKLQQSTTAAGGEDGDNTSNNVSPKIKPLPKVPTQQPVSVTPISPTMISEPISPILTPTITNINSNTKPLALEEIEIIKYYCGLRVPREDKKLEVHPPGEQNTLTYEAGDDNYQIENWCLGGLMRTLSLKTIMMTLTCILLEKFIIVTSRNIGLISNTIFSFIPLLKPYVYQGAFIPILPQSTLDVLHCPIPYVIGITKVPTDMPEIIDNCYILDVDENRLIIGKKCQNLPRLPLEERLEFSLRQFHNQLWKDTGRKYSLDYPFKIIQNDFKYIHKFSNELTVTINIIIINFIKSYSKILISIHLQLYHRFIIDSIAFYIDWNPNFDFGNKEMKEKLLKIISPTHYQFIDQFLNSQLFTSHTELLFGIKNSIFGLVCKGKKLANLILTGKMPTGVVFILQNQFNKLSFEKQQQKSTTTTTNSKMSLSPHSTHTTTNSNSIPFMAVFDQNLNVVSHLNNNNNNMNNGQLHLSSSSTSSSSSSPSLDDSQSLNQHQHNILTNNNIIDNSTTTINNNNHLNRTLQNQSALKSKTSCEELNKFHRPCQRRGRCPFHQNAKGESKNNHSVPLSSSDTTIPITKTNKSKTQQHPPTSPIKSTRPNVNNTYHPYQNFVNHHHPNSTLSSSLCEIPTNMPMNYSSDNEVNIKNHKYFLKANEVAYRISEGKNKCHGMENNGFPDLHASTTTMENYQPQSTLSFQQHQQQYLIPPQFVNQYYPFFHHQQQQQQQQLQQQQQNILATHPFYQHQQTTTVNNTNIIANHHHQFLQGSQSVSNGDLHFHMPPYLNNMSNGNSSNTSTNNNNINNHTNNNNNSQSDHPNEHSFNSPNSDHQYNNDNNNNNNSQNNNSNNNNLEGLETSNEDINDLLNNNSQ